MSKIKNAERVKNGKGLVLAEQIQPGSMLDLGKWQRLGFGRADPAWLHARPG